MLWSILGAQPFTTLQVLLRTRTSKTTNENSLFGVGVLRVVCWSFETAHQNRNTTVRLLVAGLVSGSIFRAIARVVSWAGLGRGVVDR